MSISVLVKTIAPPPLCEKEILRYAGAAGADSEMRAAFAAVTKAYRDRFTYNVCYTVLPCSVKDYVCDFGVCKAESLDLAKNLEGAEKVLLFAATVGIGIDREIAKYSRISPAKAVILQAMGAERIESLSDAFCKEMEVETGETLRARFSPGYGDLSIEIQKDIFSVLNPEKRIGLTLRDSFIMSPSKSVTAFVGFGSGKEKTPGCAACNKADCLYRGVK